MPHRLRVGFNSRYLRDNNLRGFNRYTLSLLTELRRLDELELVLFTDQRSEIHSDFIDTIGVEVVQIASPRVLLWEQVMLPIALRRHRIDVFHAPADGGLPAWKTSRSVLTYHRALDKSLRHSIKTGDLTGRVSDYLPESDGLTGRYLAYRHSLLRSVYIAAADRIIAVSDYGKWELVELLRVPEKKVVVIYEAADDKFTPDIPEQTIRQARLKFGVPDQYLLFVGSYDRWKNVDGLLRCFAGARKEGVQEGLVLVGTGGDVDGARSLARVLGLREGLDVVFLERIHQDLPPLYSGATAFITLSWGESFGLPVVEAMRSGTPVIASNRGALPEIVADGGILVDPKNVHEVVQAIVQVTSGASLRSQLREKALRRSGSFSWKNAAGETARLYQEVAGHSRRKSTRLR